MPPSPSPRSASSSAASGSFPLARGHRRNSTVSCKRRRRAGPRCCSRPVWRGRSSRLYARSFRMSKAGARAFLPWRLAAAALLFAATGALAETLDQLYENAKREGTLVFYAGGPAAPHENRAKEFMQKYPGIAVSVTGGFSNVLNERIEKQMADRKLEVDMAFFQTVQDFVS